MKTATKCPHGFPRNECSECSLVDWANEQTCDLKPVRFTTVHDRYQVCDSCCGQVETATSLKKALGIAVFHATEHSHEPDNKVTEIEVFDRMARRDCQSIWKVPVYPSGQQAAV